MKAKELLDFYLEKDFHIMKSPAMGRMIEIPYGTILHLMEHHQAMCEYTRQKKEQV